MQSDLRNNTMCLSNGEKVKKKKKKKRKKSESGVADHQELTESPEVQTEKSREKMRKKKNRIEEVDNSQQTPAVKKKKRKLNDGGEVVSGEASVMDEGVAKTPRVKHKKAESPELQESSEQTSSKKKKKKKKADATKTVCDVTAQEEHEGESGSPAALIGTKQRKTKRNVLDEPQVDPELLNELKVFCPKITLQSRSPNDINKMIMYDLPRFREFKTQGITLRHGRYSDAENDRLRQNVSDFIALTGVKDAIKLFHPKRFPEEKKDLTKLKKDYRFFERIAEGIPRPCHDVFSRGTKVFDDRNYKGSFTKEEDKALLRFYALHGSNWKKISELTGRSAYSLEKRFSHISFAKKSGPWSMKEERKLLRAVRDHIVTVLKSESHNNARPKWVSREILYQKLPWYNIAAKVKSRCWSKCREKWMSMLAVRMSSGTVFKGKKAQEAKIRLIKVMYQMQVEDVTDINWEDLTSVFGDVPPAYVQAKWHQLKVCYVPDWKSKCFGDIVDFLYEKILPGLVEECKGLDDNELKVDQKQSFLLSDIFQDIKEDDCCDSDAETG